jgi:hypothetical protein
MHGVCLTIRHTKIDRHALGVKTMGCNPVAFSVQGRIRGRRAVSGNDVKRSRGVEPAGQSVKDFEHAGVDGFDVPGTVIAQDVFDFFQRSGSVHTILTVADIQMLAGVGVEKRQVFFRIQAVSDCGNGACRLKGCRDSRQNSKLDESASVYLKSMGRVCRSLDKAGQYSEDPRRFFNSGCAVSRQAGFSVLGSRFKGSNRMKRRTILSKICDNQHNPLGENLLKPK